MNLRPHTDVLPVSYAYSPVFKRITKNTDRQTDTHVHTHTYTHALSPHCSD